jgi:hypothetical protein
MPSVIFLHLSLCFGIFNLSNCFGSTSSNKGAHECAHKLPKGIWLPFDFADSHPVSWFLNSLLTSILFKLFQRIISEWIIV